MRLISGMLLAAVLVAVGLLGGCGPDLGPAPDSFPYSYCVGAENARSGHELFGGFPSIVYADDTPVGQATPHYRQVVLKIVATAEKVAGYTCRNIRLVDLPVWFGRDFDIGQIGIYTDPNGNNRVGDAAPDDTLGLTTKFLPAFPIQVDVSTTFYVIADTSKAVPGNGLTVRLNGPVSWTVDGEKNRKIYNTLEGFPYEWRSFSY